MNAILVKTSDPTISATYSVPDMPRSNKLFIDRSIFGKIMRSSRDTHAVIPYKIENGITLF